MARVALAIRGGLWACLCLLACGEGRQGWVQPYPEDDTPAPAVSEGAGDLTESAQGTAVDIRELLSSLSNGGDASGDKADPAALEQDDSSYAVVFIHGWFGWKEQFGAQQDIERALAPLGAEPFFFAYRSSLLGSHEQTLEERAVEFSAFLASLPHHRIGIVAHSLGGIIARMALLQMPENQVKHRIDRMLFLGSPAYGGLSNIIPGLNEANVNLQRMQLGSPFMRDLLLQWRQCIVQGPCTDIWVHSLAGKLPTALTQDSGKLDFDGLVLAASAWHPGGNLTIVEHNHERIGHVLAVPEERALLLGFLDPFCDSTTEALCLPETEGSADRLDKLAPMFVAYYPADAPDPSFDLGSVLRHHSWLPSYAVEGVVSDDSTDPSTRSAYWLDTEIIPKDERIADESLPSLAFGDRRCPLPWKEVEALLGKQRIISLKVRSTENCTIDVW